MPDSTTPLTVRDLRRRWKPHKDRLCIERPDHPTTVRFHRACSWLADAERSAAEEAADIVLVQRWIAFNALYGTWCEAKREPQPDVASWKSFTERVLRMDQSGHIVGALVEHRRLVLRIHENAYLARYFWQNPTDASERRRGDASRAGQTLYAEKRWLVLTERTLERCYLLRCQLVHGASTCGGRLNREPIRHCARMLELLVMSFLQVWIDHGSDEDWGPLCYPPISDLHAGK